MLKEDAGKKQKYELNMSKATYEAEKENSQLCQLLLTLIDGRILANQSSTLSYSCYMIMVVKG